MNQTLQKTTQKLINLLPEEQQYYQPDELRTWGFPSFVVNRIRVELKRNLAESMIPPKTDWANIETEAVQHAWEQFVQAIRDETRLPASYARAVIETSVADVLDILIAPRQNVPEVIFGNDEELSYEQVCRRAEAITVYSHFSTFLPRYMEKKELDTLAKERCSQIVKQADAKMTANYSSLNWAQMLAPLFDLLDGEVEPSLFRLFFEDRNMDRFAEAFDQKDESLNRAGFIETLSTPGAVSDNPDEFSEDEEVKPVEQEKESFSNEIDMDTDYVESTTNTDDIAKQQEDDQSEPVREDEKMPTASEEQEDSEESPEQKGDEPERMNDQYEYSEAMYDPAEKEYENNSLNAIFAGEEESSEDEEEAIETSDFSDEEISTESTEEEEEYETPSPVVENKAEPGKDSDTPIWMNYMSEEDKTALEEQDEVPEELSVTGYEEETDAPVDEDGFIEEPIIDLREEESPEEETSDLSKYLSDERDRFVEEIFGGSDQAYDKAIEKIASYENWRSASKYIQKEVFKRNMVNLYSKTAVNFTDRLQNYFLKKENQ
ncbi:hypothetical protein Asal01_02870 [Fodinibius salicampi]